MEAHDVIVAEAIFVSGGKIAKNPVANLSAGGIGDDGFADEEGAVGLKCDVAMKIEDVFCTGGRGKGALRQQQQEESSEDQTKTHEHRPAELSPC